MKPCSDYIVMGAWYGELRHLFATVSVFVYLRFRCQLCTDYVTTNSVRCPYIIDIIKWTLFNCYCRLVAQWFTLILHLLFLLIYILNSRRFSPFVCFVGAYWARSLDDCSAGSIHLSCKLWCRALIAAPGPPPGKAHHRYRHYLLLLPNHRGVACPLPSDHCCAEARNTAITVCVGFEFVCVLICWPNNRPMLCQLVVNPDVSQSGSFVSNASASVISHRLQSVRRADKLTTLTATANTESTRC